MSKTVITLPSLGLTDANADRILMWDDSAGAIAQLAASTNLTISGTNITGDTQGISEFDMWRVTSSFSNSSNGANEVLTANSERGDTVFDKIGTGLSESSGVFTFPSTGIYLVQVHAFFYPDGANSDIRVQIRVTTDNSTYSTRAESMNGASAADRPEQMTCAVGIDVTNVSNDKFRIHTQGTTASNFWRGDTGAQKFGFTCIRLGDT